MIVVRTLLEHVGGDAEHDAGSVEHVTQRAHLVVTTLDTFDALMETSVGGRGALRQPRGSYLCNG